MAGFLKTTALLAGVATLGAAPAFAQAAEEAGTSPWSLTEQTRVRLISATRAVGNAATVQLGLQFKLKPEWKVYWRAPGDAGFPPRLDLSRSVNLKSARFDWPAPSRFSVLGFETQGYKKEVIFPVTAILAEPGKPLRLRAKLDYLTCNDVCIPYRTQLSLDLPAGPAATTHHFQAINRFAARVPGDGSRHGLKIASAELAGPLAPAEKGLRDGLLRVKVSAAQPFESPDMFVEGPEEMVFAKPKLRLSDGGRTASLLIPVNIEEGTALADRPLTFTLTDGARSAERRLTVTRGPPEAAEAGGFFSAYSLPVILALALLGGLILNLMPCVLPVLSLKLLGLVGHGGGDRSRVRVSFVASSAGIVFSFLAIAGALVALKFAGQAVGWGIQFQHPWFLVTLILIVSLFAFNLWGLFEVTLHYRLSSLMGGTGNSDSIGGNFATGAFATLLATPCSAPFLGTAVGFALAGSTEATFAVFAALGIGMASPYLLLAALPGLATRFPKPGNWMIRLKQFLGVALAATAVWLLSVIAIQVSLTAAFVLGGLMVAMGAAFWARNRLAQGRRWVAGAMVAVIALVSFVVPGQFQVAGAGTAVAKAHWQPFDPAAIPRLVAEGRTVFVDVTAEWCITCQVNKAVVLNRGRIAELLKSDTVYAMQGDWTRPDPKIAAYLASFGRFGIPFNAVYGPKVPDGVVLPELLTSGSVLAGLENASGRPDIAAR